MMMTPTSTIPESMTAGDNSSSSSSKKTAGLTGGCGGSDSSSSSSSMSVSVSIPAVARAASENIPSTSSPDEVIHESLHESMNSSSQDLHPRHHHHPQNNSNPSSSQNSKNETTTQRRQANSSSCSVVNPAIVSHSSNGRRRYRKISVWVVVGGCIIGCYQNLFVQSMKTIKKTPSSSSGVGIGTTNTAFNATTTSGHMVERDSASLVVQEMKDVDSKTETVDQVHEGSISSNDNIDDEDTNETDDMGGGSDDHIKSKRTISNDKTLRSPRFGLAALRVVQLEQLLSSRMVDNSSIGAAKIERDRVAVMKNNTRPRMGSTVVVVVEPPGDIEFPLISSMTEQTMNNSTSVDNFGRTMVLQSSSSPSLDDDGERDDEHIRHYPDNNYRTYERDWFEECEDVTTTKRVVSTQGVDGDEIHDEDDHRIIVHPTCNQFHELDVASDDDNNVDVVESHSVSIEREESTVTPISTNIQLLSMQGSWRSVWKISTSEAPNSTSLILKMLQLDREFDEESFKMHQMDAIVMDKLTASSRIVNSYGFCGQSVMTQTATISSGGKALKGDENMKTSKGSSKSQSSWADRLTVARDIAHGLAELQALTPYDLEIHRNQSSSSIQGHLRKTKKSTTIRPMKDLIFAHHDINPSNVIGVDGRVLFNDFNLGILKRQRIDHLHNQGQNLSDLVEPVSSKNTTVCPVPIRYYSSLWRSPEEIENKTGYLEDTRTNPHASQAADVYSLGNLLFIILTKHQPWWHLEEPTKPTLDEIATYKLEGRLPYVPDKFLSSATTRKNDDVGGSNNGTRVVPILAAQDLWTITKMCFRLNPSDRPTALEVAILLDRAHRDEIERIKNKEPKSTPNKTKKVKVENDDDYSEKTKDKDKATRIRTSKTG